MISMINQVRSFDLHKMSYGYVYGYRKGKKEKSISSI